MKKLEKLLNDKKPGESFKAYEYRRKYKIESVCDFKDWEGCEERLRQREAIGMAKDASKLGSPVFI